MKRSSWKTYAVWILLPELVGALSGWLTRNDTQVYEESIRQPPLSPPSLVFPIVWAILFALMGIAAARVWLSAPSPGTGSGACGSSARSWASTSSGA